MLMVPTRPVVAVLAATVKPSDPFPLPLAAVVSVIQLTVLLAVHGHPAVAVMPTDPGPPAAAIDADEGWSVIAHETGGGGVAGAACEIVIATPPAVTVPMRAAPGLAVTVKLILPLPDPDNGDGVIHPTLLATVQLQPEGAATVMLPLPPDDENWFVLTLTATSHGAGSCRTTAR